ncbi:MAG: DUF1540 domain-containing protein [Planctomycetota bacterium]|jgi:hypothetical protein
MNMNEKKGPGTSRVVECRIRDCAYNLDNLCHARAVTIGDISGAKCGTYCSFMLAVQRIDTGSTAMVGACKMGGCAYNAELNCHAEEIVIDYRQDQPECLIYESIAGLVAADHKISSRMCDADLHSEAPEIFIG